MLTVTSINKGIVIDHIKAGLGIKLFHHLRLDKAEFPVALISNCASKKLGKKDIIKIQNLIELDFKELGLIDPGLTISIIENNETIKKFKLELPEKVEDVLFCKNPRCITSIERNIVHVFQLVDRASATYKCEYCEETQNRMEL